LKSPAPIYTQGLHLDATFATDLITELVFLLFLDHYIDFTCGNLFLGARWLPIRVWGEHPIAPKWVFFHYFTREREIYENA
jgi:hypothetical protein